MNTKPINLILWLAISALFTTCSKDNLSPLEQLPPITSHGANTFGCLLNGEPVVFTNPKQISFGLIADYDKLGELPYDSSDMWLIFSDGKHTVNLLLTNPLVKNSWELNHETYVYPTSVKPKDYLMVDGFLSSNNTSGFFKSEPFKQTIPYFSGTFQFKCVNTKTCKVMEVTHGRLDINIRDLQ